MARETESILEITDLVKVYGKGSKAKTAVSGINLSVPRGSFFGLLGPNGAGKSTTIGCVTGTHIITSGKIVVNGFDVVDDYRQARQQIGLSAQEYNVNPFEPVNQLIEFMAGYYGVPARRRRERMEQLLTELDLHPHRDKQFRELSGGLKRRVVLARALVHEPSLLILDEPTAGIDVEQRRAVWALLEDLNAKGVSIIMTSHYLEEMERLCDQIAIINHGEVVANRCREDYHTDGRTLEEEYLAITQATRHAEVSYQHV